MEIQSSSVRTVTCEEDGERVDHVLLTLSNSSRLDWCQRCWKVFPVKDDDVACHRFRRGGQAIDRTGAHPDGR